MTDARSDKICRRCKCGFTVTHLQIDRGCLQACMMCGAVWPENLSGPFASVDGGQRVSLTSKAGVLVEAQVSPERVNHPAHYGGEDNPYEVIKVLEAWFTTEELRGFVKGNAIKYMARANKKGATQEDHEKAAWYSQYLAKMGD